MSRFLAVIGLLLATAPTFADTKAPRAPAKTVATGRLVVGLKAPLAPPAIRELARELKVRVVRVMPGSVNLLVVARPGVTPARIERHPRVAWVEKEITMGESFRLEDARLAAR